MVSIGPWKFLNLCRNFLKFGWLSYWHFDNFSWTIGFNHSLCMINIWYLAMVIPVFMLASCECLTCKIADTSDGQYFSIIVVSWYWFLTTPVLWTWWHVLVSRYDGVSRYWRWYLSFVFFSFVHVYCKTL